MIGISPALRARKRADDVAAASPESCFNVADPIPLVCRRQAGCDRIIPLPWVRICVKCGIFVGNQNLGGRFGRSAMTGALMCYDCAD